MKKLALTACFLSIIPLVLFAQSDSNDPISVHDKSGIFIDARDGQLYNWIRIGEQAWMAKNLNYNAKSSCWCYSYNNENCDTYGRLFTWEMAQNVCPKGWHLPEDSEWKQLEKYLGMKDSLLNRIDPRGAKVNIGGKMKATFGWNPPNTGATNESGFNALPAGYCNSHSEFIRLDYGAYFWSSTSFGESYAYLRGFYYYYNGIYRSYWHKSNAFSVRCVKDL
jgi:uncharacterized protein (TIGR02145 family)